MRTAQLERSRTLRDAALQQVQAREASLQHVQAAQQLQEEMEGKDKHAQLQQELRINQQEEKANQAVAEEERRNVRR